MVFDALHGLWSDIAAFKHRVRALQVKVQLIPNSPITVHVRKGGHLLLKTADHPPRTFTGNITLHALKSRQEAVAHQHQPQAPHA